jgi:hypothetical protein
MGTDTAPSSDSDDLLLQAGCDSANHINKLSQTKLRVGFETFASSIPAQHYPLSPPTTPSPAYGLQHARSQTLIRIGNQRPAALRLAGSASAAATCCLPACSKPACSKKSFDSFMKQRSDTVRHARLTVAPAAPLGPAPSGWWVLRERGKAAIARGSHRTNSTVMSSMRRGNRRGRAMPLARCRAAPRQASSSSICGTATGVQYLRTTTPTALQLRRKRRGKKGEAKTGRLTFDTPPNAVSTEPPEAKP